MTNYLFKSDKKLMQLIRTIGKYAECRQCSAYVVGGCVRDLILGKKILDLDISVEGDAISLAQELARKWHVRCTVYKEFQTASLNLPGNVRVDLARTRKEHYAHPGALPTVRPGSLREDLYRRDFTVNAMAIAVNPSTFGQLIDMFEGFGDLKKRTIKVLHDQSFIDDPTRILRAVRFEQRFHFRIGPSSLKLLRSALKKRAEEKVTCPRYFAEFKKILCETDPVKPIKRLHHLKGFRFLVPNLRISFHILSDSHRHVRKIKRLSQYKDFKQWWLIYFFALIDNVSGRSLQGMFDSFHFKKEDKISILKSRKARSILRSINGKHVRASQVYLILKPLPYAVICYLRVITSNTTAARRIDRFLKEHRDIKLKISGEDLKKMGCAPGLRIGKVLESVLCLKIDNHITTKRDELKNAMHSLGKC